MTSTLLPIESMTMMVVRAQLERGEIPDSAMTAMLLLAIDRMTGVADWTDNADDIDDD